MARIFLSASVPLPSRHPRYFDTADVLAIRDAVRALALAVSEVDATLVFGGHPAITPVIRLQIAAAGGRVGSRFVLHQSRYFRDDFPVDNGAFERVELAPKVGNDRDASLALMRERMLLGSFGAAIFVGGMEGVEDEYKLFQQKQPGVPLFPVASTGAAARVLFERDPTIAARYPELRDEVSYLGLMRRLVGTALGSCAADA
jgi:hypothetical protein